MAHVISVGQTYQHQDGDEYEVVTVDKDRVTFETPSGSIVCMDIDELMSNLDEGCSCRLSMQMAKKTTTMRVKTGKINNSR